MKTKEPQTLGATVAPGSKPERQPLKLPPDFDFSDYPHYSVQSSIYSLLLTALNLAEYYERIAGMEARQKTIEEAIKVYEESCDALKIPTQPQPK